MGQIFKRKPCGQLLQWATLSLPVAPATIHLNNPQAVGPPLPPL